MKRVELLSVLKKGVCEKSFYELIAYNCLSDDCTYEFSSFGGTGYVNIVFSSAFVSQVYLKTLITNACCYGMSCKKGHLVVKFAFNYD